MERALKANTLASAVEASAAALAIEDGQARSAAPLVSLERRLLKASRSYVDIDVRLKQDASPAANRKCAEAWRKCEEIVDDISRHRAESLGDLQIKARALAWTASDTVDVLLKGIAEDLRTLPQTAVAVSPTEAKSPGMCRLDLESTLLDASSFGRLAYHAFCNLGFENREPPKLDQDETDLVYWAISELSGMIDNAKAAFFAQCEAEGRARVGAEKEAAS